MPRPRLFCPTLTESPVRLSLEESRHATASLRVKPGDELELFDGRGRQAIARVTRIRRAQVEVEIAEMARHPFELSCRLTLAVAMPKAHRQAYLIEKCTELGVAAIWPILAQRSVTQPRMAARTKWARRAIEAAKQSRRVWVPQIDAPQPFSEAVGRIRDFDASALTHADESAVPFPTFLASQRHANSLLVWVGPEGGWTEAERDRAVAAGANLARLGPTVLRTETAAVAICAALAMMHANGT